MIDVIMPKMGESITEGTVVEWKKEIGEQIQKDETLLEISTDKVDSEVPSPASGTIIEILANVNDTVPVGEIIARIGDQNETASVKESKNINKEVVKLDIENEKNKNEESLKVEKTQYLNIDESNITSSDKDRFYSPLVKAIAKKENVSQNELDKIQGSGKNGRVNKFDILTFISKRVESQIDIDKNKDKSNGDLQNLVESANKVEPMSRIRKKIAEHMVSSVQTSPHVYTTVEADVTNFVNMRTKFKDSFKEKSGVSLTYTPMLLDASIRAIQAFPLINSSVEGENIIYHENINMGVAVALPNDNLIVPVIQASEEKNFLGLARSTSDLAKRARSNNLNPNEVSGSTFTVTNPGVFGGLFGMGIINQPNVGILAIGSFQKRPVVKETEYGDTIVVRHMVYLTLSYDHRIIDGAYGTKFLSHLVDIVESYGEDRVNN